MNNKEKLHVIHEFLHWARDNGHCDSETSSSLMATANTKYFPEHFPASPSIETLMNVVTTKGKIAAINMYREQTGTDLQTARQRIERWMVDTKTETLGTRLEKAQRS